MKISLKRLTVLALMLALASCAPKNSELTKAQMREDVSYFFTSFLNTHPNPYCRATPRQVDSIKTSLLHKIDDGLTKDEFLNELGKLNGLLDGHSHIDSPSLKFTQKDTLVLPPVVQINSDLSLSLDDTQLPVRNTITSINGIPSSKLLDVMSRMISSDPGVCGKVEIEKDFSVLLKRCGLLSPYHVKVRTPSGDTSLTIKGTYPSSNSIFHRSSGELPRKEFGCTIYPKSSIGIIYFNTCKPANAEIFKRQIESSFIELKRKNIKHLIIDNSRNEGGDDNFGAYLISKVNHGPYRKTVFVNGRMSKEEYSDIQRKIRQVLKSDSANHLSSKTRNAIKKCTKIPAGGHLTDTIFQHTPAVTDGYSGKVYMLVSNRTFSSGSNTAWFFRLAKAGKILGEKSGSANPKYVYPAKFTLPNSKVKFGISVRQGGYVTFEGKKMVYLKEPDPDVPFNINPFKTSYSEQELLELLRMANKK
ncbi:S41 family peptidase [uncultured Acetobacteroides sp.]|uniref:S41 family peptidase n=1 Tax=uncultured Acetobacteroides sp. TaxID=1760811 RepID=UPI0029F4CECE|nr:S41 family peptidase [uncultured Acetobacteroides sp.]